MSRSTLRWLRRVAIGLVALLMLGFAVGSLAGAKKNNAPSTGVHRTSFSANTATDASRAFAYPSKVAGVGAVEAPVQQAAPGPASKLGGQPLPPDLTKVIKTGDLTIECAK